MRGVVSAFGTGFSEHIQGNTPLSTDLAAHPVHALLPRPMTTIATLHGVGGGGPQRVIKPCQGVFTMRRADLCYGVAHPRAPLDPLPQLLQRAQCGRRVATPVKPRVAGLHDLAQCAPMRQATRAGQAPCVCARLQSTFDAHQALLEPGTDVLWYRWAFAGRAAGRLVLR